MNLYIDLKTGAIGAAEVANVLNKMARDGDARLRFYRCVEDEENQSDCICRHYRGEQSIEGDRYVRIMPFTSMVKYCSGAISATYSADREAEVEEMFYAADPAERVRLGVLERFWCGRMENVWVTSKTELDQVLELDVSPQEKASRLRTRLGFYKYDVGRLVFVAYPSGTDFVAAFQPTSLDANTTSSFFISKGSHADTWGETCSLNSTFDGMRERVHRGFEGLTDAFESEIIGPVEPEDPDMDHFLSVAWSRVP
jgi:hypothetical protein